MALNSNNPVDRRRKISAASLNDNLKSTQRDFKGGMNTVGAEISSSGQTSQEIVLPDGPLTWLGQVVETGPDAEADFNDERYWVQAVSIENSDGDDCGQLDFEKITDTDDPDYRHVCASNLLEVDLDEVHLVALGTYVQVFQVYDKHSPDSREHWVFEAHHTGLVEDPHIVPEDDFRWDRHNPPADTLGVVINDVRLGAGGNVRVDLIFDHSGHLRQTCEHDEGCETSTTTSSTTTNTPTPTPTPANTDPPTNPPPQDCTGVDYLECPGASGNKYYAVDVTFSGPEWVPDCNEEQQCDSARGRHILTYDGADQFKKQISACLLMRVSTQGTCELRGAAVDVTVGVAPCLPANPDGTGCVSDDGKGPYMDVGNLGNIGMKAKTGAYIDCDGQIGWNLKINRWYKCT